MEPAHGGHRRRMKERFLKEGLSGFTPAEVLELLLYYAVPRKDTAALADELLRTFGSLSGVLEAPFEALANVNGAGRETALFLRLLLPAWQAYLRSAQSGHPVLNTPQKCGEYLLGRYFGAEAEKMSVLCLNGVYELQRFVWLGAGDGANVTFGAKAVLAAVTEAPCTLAVLAHNHPSNLLFPSEADVALTRRARELLNAVGVRLADHLILGRGDFLSMADSANYKALFA